VATMSRRTPSMTGMGGGGAQSRGMTASRVQPQGGGIDFARKDKLRSALVKKLMSKYHPGIANSKTEQLVNREVDALMQMSKVTEEVLHEVEIKVRKQSNDEIALLVTNPFRNVTSFKSGASDEWAAMNDMVVRAGMEADARQSDKRNKAKAEFRRQLDEQMVEAEARKRAEKMEKQAESKRVLDDVKSYVKAMDDKKRDQQTLFEKIRQDREEEMRQTRQRHDLALKAKRQDEQDEITKVKKQQQLEYDRLQKQKKEDAEKLRKWKLENERNLAEKERLRQIQHKEDLEFSRKAQKALDDAEARRIEDLRILNEKMKAKDKYAQILGASNAATAAEDEARMIKIQAEAKKKAEMQYVERLQREHQKKIEVRQTLDKQVSEMEARKMEEKATIKRQSDMFKAQAAEAMAEERRKLQREKQARDEYRMQLEDQLRQDVKLRPARELMMSEVERKINKSFRPR